MRFPNHRHEAYATARAAGYSQTESAKRAGYPRTSAPNAGHRLEKQDAIKGRVAELLAAGKQTDSYVASRPWIECQLVEIVRTAVHPDSRDLSNANRALETLAKMGGHMDRREPNSEMDLLSLGGDQVSRFLSARLAELPPVVRETVLSELPAEVIELVTEAEQTHLSASPRHPVW
jgi:hypothetical protein